MQIIVGHIRDTLEIKTSIPAFFYENIVASERTKDTKLSWDIIHFSGSVSLLYIEHQRSQTRIS